VSPRESMPAKAHQGWRKTSGFAAPAWAHRSSTYPDMGTVTLTVAESSGARSTVAPNMTAAGVGLKAKP
jgi:hypothetical protein